MSKPDRAVPGYAAALASSLRWDGARDEPYLQLPSFPDLRLVPYRPGIADDLVALFNHPAVGTRLFALPYPCVCPELSDGRMDRAFAAQMEADTLAKQAPMLELLRTTALPQGGEAHAPVWPFKALWSESAGRVVGDVFLWPNTAEPLWDEARAQKAGATEKGCITEASVLALPAQEQSWMLGYVLEPALYGRGVMSELLGCVLRGWVKRVMRVGEVAAFIETNNPGSEAVARRNGFVWRREERTDWPEEKGGGVHVNGYYTVDMRS